MSKGLSQKNKVMIFAAAGLVLSLLNIYGYHAHFEEHLKLRDYTASEQLLYNPSFAEEGYAPDPLIREFVRNRKVSVPRDIRPYKEYYSYGHMHEEGNDFAREYFWENNYIKYLKEYSASVTVDNNLPDLYRLQEQPLPEEIKNDFIKLGAGNELLRYAHVADHTDEEVTNQFFYTFIYTVDTYYPWSTEEENMQIRVCTKEFDDEDALVALWDTGDNLYIMSDEYYVNHISERYPV